VAFRFFPDTANDPSTIYDPNGDIASIVHTSTGLFTVTLGYPVPRVMAATATLQLATVGVARDVKIGATSTTENTSSNLSFTVSVTNGASAVDIAADPDNSISVALALETSTAGVVSR
jgi:hypothetical protein